MANQLKHRFDRGRLTDRLTKIGWRGKASFAVCCATRMTQVYAQSPIARPEGGPLILDRCLAECQEHIMAEAPEAAQVNRLLRECEGLIADLPVAEESAVMATMFAIRCILTDSPDDSAECASEAYELVHGVAMDSLGLSIIRASDAGKLDAARAHPLVQLELSRQERDLTEVEAAEENGVPYGNLVPVLTRRARFEAKDFLLMRE